MRTSIQAAMAAINLYSEYFLGLIVSLTIARSLSTDDYGIYSSILWIAGLITLAINAGLAINVTKFVAEFKKKDEESLPAIIAYFWRIQHIRIAIVAVIACGILACTYGSSKMEMWLLITLFICATIKADYMFRMAIFKGIKRYDVLAKTSLIANPFNIVTVLLCAYFGASLENFILVYCSACLIYGASSRFFNSELPEKKWNESVVEAHKKRIVFQMLSATGIVFLGALIFRQSQVIVLEQNNFLSEAGFFNIAFLLSTAAMTLIPGVYQEILLPKITDAVQNGDVESQVAQAERYLITLSLLVVFPVLIYADVIIDILYGERYKGAVFPLQVMIVLKTILTFNQGANLTLISNDKQVGMVKIKVVMIVIAAVLSVILVSQWGMNGALLTYAILSGILLIAYSRLARQCGYKMMKFTIIMRIVLAAVVAVLPVLFINIYIKGISAAIIGSLVFCLIYVNALFITKGYDASVSYILKKMAPSVSGIVSAYLNWCIRRLS
jgi:O-antigen/teichoic acid export membrane protein